MSDTDCRLKDGHRYVDGRCVWCDALQEVSNSGADLTGTVLDDGPLIEEEINKILGDGCCGGGVGPIPYPLCDCPRSAKNASS